MDSIDKNNETKNINEEKNKDEKINDLNKSIIKSEIEYDELFDLITKRRQLLEKNKLL
jgi:hypothetical protein